MVFEIEKKNCFALQKFELSSKKIKDYAISLFGVPKYFRLNEKEIISDILEEQEKENSKLAQDFRKDSEMLSIQFNSFDLNSIDFEENSKFQEKDVSNNLN